MTSPFVDAALISCLESIRDVAADLSRELDRPKSRHGASVKAMVGYIEHKAGVALTLIETVRRRDQT